MGSPEDMADVHRVHLLQYWGDGAAPTDLRVRPRRSAGATAFLGALLGVVVVAGVGPIVLLWTLPTPGWWFSLLFTIMIGSLVLGCCLGYLDSLRRGRRREWAAARWTEILPALRPSPGTILARDVATREDGAVARFSLTVGIQDRARVTGVWTPRSSRSGGLLQTQVPGVGASVRVWRATGAPDADPVVIEALDPSVTPPAAASELDKYVD